MDFQSFPAYALDGASVALVRKDCAVDNGVFVRSRKTPKTLVRRLVSPFRKFERIGKLQNCVTDGSDFDVGKPGGLGLLHLSRELGQCGVQLSSDLGPLRARNLRTFLRLQWLRRRSASGLAESPAID